MLRTILVALDERFAQRDREAISVAMKELVEHAYLSDFLDTAPDKSDLLRWLESLEARP